MPSQLTPLNLRVEGNKEKFRQRPAIRKTGGDRHEEDLWMLDNKVNWGTLTLAGKISFRAVGTALMLAAAGASLAGCGMPSFGGLLGNPQMTPLASAGVSEAAMLSAAKSSEGVQLADAAGARSCPQFTTWPLSQVMTVYEQGREGDALAVVHRGEITQTARECQIEGGRVAIKYGFSGRILLGPKGVAGHVGLPVNIVLTDSAKQTVLGDALRVEVDITPDQPIGYFSSVRTITFDVPEGGRVADYKLYVAFDKVPGTG